MTEEEKNENKESGRLSFRIDNKTREEWKAKRKLRGFSDWMEYFDYLIKSDTGNMMDKESGISREEIQSLKELNKALLEQITILSDQLKNFNYMGYLESLNKKLNNHLQEPKIEALKEVIPKILEESNTPLALSTIKEKITIPEVNINEILLVLTELEENNKVKRDFYHQTYTKV